MSVLPPGGNPVLEDTDPKGDVLPPGAVTDPNEAYLNAMRTIRLAADILIREGQLPESFTGYVTPTQLADQVAILQTWTMENFFLKAESGDLVLGIGDIAGLQEALDAKIDSAGFTVDMDDIDGLLTALGNKAPTGHGHDIGDVSGLQTALDALAGADTAMDARLDALETNDATQDSRLDALEASPSGAAWGGIGGTLSDQTDLQAALTALTNADSALDSRVDALEAAPPSSAVWGGIGGTLSDQTDLQAALTALTGADSALDARVDALEAAPGAPDTFLELTDTPASFSSQAGKRLRVNTGAAALEFFDEPVTVHITVIGKPDGDELLIYMPVGFPAKMNQGNYNGFAQCKIAPTADAEFWIKKNTTTIGRVLFNTGQTSGIVNIYDDETFTATTLLVLEAPDPQDATLADIGISIPMLKGI